MIFNSQYIRYLSLLTALVFALPIPLGIFTGLYLWFSPFILFNSLLALKHVVPFQLFGLIVLIFIFLKHRWFCRFVCPTGALCDDVSKIGMKQNNLHRIPFLHKPLFLIAMIIAGFGVPLLIVLDPVNLFYAFFDAFQPLPAVTKLIKISGFILIVCVNIIVPHIWCRRLCPLGGMQDFITDVKGIWKAKATVPIDQGIHGRRYFLAGLVGVGMGVGSREMVQAKKEEVLRPPGALPESQFKTVCARCGNCAKACPTNIIQASFDPDDLLGALTPQIHFHDSYCLPECTRCGSVCPSGAISQFTVDEKKRLVIGIAHIELSDCLLTHFKECDRCKTYCEFDAIEIRTSDDGFTAYPVVLKDRCVGCGACQIVCPVNVIVIKST